MKNLFPIATKTAPGTATHRQRNAAPVSLGVTRPKQRPLTEEEVHETVGNRTISAWRVAPDAVWVQLRCPVLAERVSKLKGARRIDKGSMGGFLRIYELPRSLTWARSYAEKTINAINN